MEIAPPKTQLVKMRSLGLVLIQSDHPNLVQSGHLDTSTQRGKMMGRDKEKAGWVSHLLITTIKCLRKLPLQIISVAHSLGRLKFKIRKSLWASGEGWSMRRQDHMVRQETKYPTSEGACVCLLLP